jgi:hypothetical protein
MSVEDRIDRLERENRRLKLAGGGVAAAALIVVLAGAAATQQPDIIEVRGLILKDADGKKLGEMTSNEMGTGIVFYGAEGGPRAMFGIQANGNGGLNVASDETTLVVVPAGWAVTRDGKPVVAAGTGPMGTGFGVEDEKGSTKIWAQGMSIKDKDGKTGLNFMLKYPDGNPGIRILNGDGTKRKL